MHINYQTVRQKIEGVRYKIDFDRKLINLRSYYNLVNHMHQNKKRSQKM